MYEKNAFEFLASAFSLAVNAPINAHRTSGLVGTDAFVGFASISSGSVASPS